MLLDHLGADLVYLLGEYRSLLVSVRQRHISCFNLRIFLASSEDLGVEEGSLDSAKRCYTMAILVILRLIDCTCIRT